MCLLASLVPYAVCTDCASAARSETSGAESCIRPATACECTPEKSLHIVQRRPTEGVRASAGDHEIPSDERVAASGVHREFVSVDRKVVRTGEGAVNGGADYGNL